MRTHTSTSDFPFRIYRKFCKLIGKNPEACRPFLLNSQGDHP